VKLNEWKEGEGHGKQPRGKTVIYWRNE